MGGRWLKRYDSWLKEEIPVKKIAPVDAGEYSVQYIPLRCPQCKSKDVFCYATRPPIRYHKCKQCGISFKSVERKE